METSRKWKHGSVVQESHVGKAAALGFAVEDKQNHTIIQIRIDENLVA